MSAKSINISSLFLEPLNQIGRFREIRKLSKALKKKEKKGIQLIQKPTRITQSSPTLLDLSNIQTNKRNLPFVSDSHVLNLEGLDGGRGVQMSVVIKMLGHLLLVS